MFYLKAGRPFFSVGIRKSKKVFAFKKIEKETINFGTFRNRMISSSVRVVWYTQNPEDRIQVVLPTSEGVCMSAVAFS
jgi:type IV secretory pathway ATPase VirB11/archaellum biosynthesis ATPase